MCEDFWVPSPTNGSGSPLAHSKAPRPKPLGLLAAHRRAQKAVPKPQQKPPARRR